jgi:hypothetical protein
MRHVTLDISVQFPRAPPCRGYTIALMTFIGRPCRTSPLFGVYRILRNTEQPAHHALRNALGALLFWLHARATTESCPLALNSIGAPESFRNVYATFMAASIGTSSLDFLALQLQASECLINVPCVSPVSPYATAPVVLVARVLQEMFALQASLPRAVRGLSHCTNITVTISSGSALLTLTFHPFIQY